MAHVQRQRVARRRRPRRPRAAAARARRSRAPSAAASAIRRDKAELRGERRVRGEAVAGADQASPCGQRERRGPRARRATGRHHRPPRSVVRGIGRHVDLAHPRIEAREHPRHAVRAPRLLRDRLERRHRRRPAGRRRSASPCATPQPMRMPVNDPGPAPKAMPSSWPQRPARFREHRVAPSAAAAPSAPGRRARRATCQRRPSPTATLHHSVDVSSARIRMARILLGARRVGAAVAATVQCGSPCPCLRLRSATFRPPSAVRVADDRVARPGRPRRRPRRRQGGLRRGRAARRDARRSRRCKRKPTYEIARARRFCERERRPRRAALPAFRRVRRLLAAALRRRRAGRGQAAHARGRAVAHRPRPRRHSCCRRSTARRGATAIARGCRCATSPKKGGVLIGFHERKSSYVADMTSCAVLPPKISALLPALRALVGGLSIRDRLPQIELAVGDGDATPALRAGAAHPGAARAARRRRARRVRRCARRRSSSCRPAARTRAAPLRSGASPPRLRAARVRPASSRTRRPSSRR